jgi:protein-tyrosine-phosphatase/DNA-binding transcriptional ArsR family regulator
MEIQRATQAFAALAQESRLAAMRLLIARGQEGLSAGDLAEGLRLPASTTSFHLSALERAGLVVSTRHGRQIIYAIRMVALRELLVFLTEACCAGRPDIGDDIARLLPGLPEETDRMTPAFNVLFLCTRNSARSIMAEAILAKVGRGRFRAYSAGSHPAAAPMPGVIEKLRVLGHDVSGLHCKSWDEFTRLDAPRMDFVIALCDTLENQACPDFGETVITGAWPLPDPAKFSGNDAERSTMLNELYGSLRRRIEIFTSLPFAALDRLAMRRRLDEIGAGPVGTLARATAR